MPPRGGAFFGFAIVVAAALVTWGIIALVDYAENNNNDGSVSGGASRAADSDLQAELNNASPGDTIFIPVGTHFLSLTTSVDGERDRPITITCAGSSRGDCVLRGDSNARVLDIRHSYYIIRDFTIDGQVASDEYREQLIFVHGTQSPYRDNGVEVSLTGVTIRGMDLRNAGRECVRLRFFVTDSVVEDNLIGPCGIEDFVLNLSSSSNGEGIYIGTALSQVDRRNDPDERVDECSGIVVMNNLIDTQGSEGVDIKEGCYENVVYNNIIRGQMHPATGGLSIRGDYNVVYKNTIEESEGSCIRIGGNDYDGNDYGANNEVYENILDRCKFAAIVVNDSPQIICENRATPATDPNDDELYALVRGDAAADFDFSVSTGCPSSLTDISALIEDGNRDFSIQTDDYQVTQDDDDINRSPAPAPSPSPSPDDDEILGSDTYVYRGCYRTPPQASDLFESVSFPDNNLSVAKCIGVCVQGLYVFAAIQDGSTCLCGNGDGNGDGNYFAEFGTSLACTTGCTGTDEQLCGGVASFSLYEIYGDGGVPPVQDQGTGDGNGTPSTPSPTSIPMAGRGDPAPADDDGVPAVPNGSYLGCYRDSDSDPVLEFQYEDEDSLTPASCIETCRDKSEDISGVMGGSQCWCGTPEDYAKYGSAPSSCTFPCSGDRSQHCGGRGSLDLWTVG